MDTILKIHRFVHKLTFSWTEISYINPEKTDFCVDEASGVVRDALALPR